MSRLFIDFSIKYNKKRDLDGVKMRNYGDSLRYQRELNGYTQLSLSKATGLKQPMISWWEAGKGLPNIDFCVQLAKFYGITLEELLGIDDSPATVSIKSPAPALSEDEKELLKIFSALSESGRDTVMVAARNAARFENKGSIHKRA